MCVWREESWPFGLRGSNCAPAHLHSESGIWSQTWGPIGGGSLISAQPRGLCGFFNPEGDAGKRLKYSVLRAVAVT